MLSCHRGTVTSIHHESEGLFFSPELYCRIYPVSKVDKSLRNTTSNYKWRISGNTKCWYLELISIVSCRAAPVFVCSHLWHQSHSWDMRTSKLRQGKERTLGSAKMGHRRPPDPGAGKCGRTGSCVSQVKSMSLSAAEGTTSSGGCVQQQCLAGC